MEVLGAAQPAPTEEELISLLGEDIQKVATAESADETDSDRVWWLRRIHKNYTYYRNLQSSAPSFFQGMADYSSVGGADIGSDSGSGIYDYSQNYYLGFCRKLEAVLGTRMPNAQAVPDNPSDDADIRAAQAANDAAEWMRQKCELQAQILYLVFGLFNFGTNFWFIDFEFDGDKHGWNDEPIIEPQDQQLGGAGFDCPQCGEAIPSDAPESLPPNCPACAAPTEGAQFRAPQSVQVPQQTGSRKTPKGMLVITVHNGSEISVPLDSLTASDALWLERNYERHKAFCLKKYGDAARKVADSKENPGPSTEVTASSQYGEAIRSAMASPIGIVRPKRESQWTVTEKFWQPAMYELFEKDKRSVLTENYPKGLKITLLRGRIIKLEDAKPSNHWQECKPEPSMRIMGDPLGDDWTSTQDLLDNTLNQMVEVIERSNSPGFADPTRVDFDALQRRRDCPAEWFPMLPRAGQSLSDSVHRPEPIQFSEQVPAFRGTVLEASKINSGLTDTIYGGDNSDPTARQTELKTNAAIRQLGVIWVMIGKSLEKVYEKSCRLVAEFEDGVLSFSKKNQFGTYSQVAVVTEDLRNGKYHFEADEAVPMTWGQQRDLLMFMLDKSPDILERWGYNDPLNVPELKRLLGMPGMRTPLEDDRESGMATIGELLKAKPSPGQPDQTGQPGPPQASIQPKWEENHDFLAKLAKAYLTDNYELEQESPDGYQNVQLWGQAQESAANQPPPPAPPKTSVSLSLKGEDLGDPAVQAAITGSGIVPQGTPVEGAMTRMQQMPPPPVNGAPSPPMGPPQ